MWIRQLARHVGAFVLTTLVAGLLGATLVRFGPGFEADDQRLDPRLNASSIQALEQSHAGERNVFQYYSQYLRRMLHGDFGVSIITKNPILQEFFTLFPATVELSTCALLFAIIIGVPAGVLAASRRGGIYDQSLMGLALTGYSMPIFWWGLILILVVSNTLGWTPVSGRVDLIKYYYPQVTGFMLIDSLLSGEKGAFADALRHLILPTIVLGTVPLAVIARMTRSSMLEVLEEDYVRTARAKGLAPYRVIGIHALRNALIPVVTVIGLSVGTLLAGAVLTETIFSWPGVGKWLIESIGRRDYPALQGGIMLISSIVIVVNLLVDLTYGLINPRIRHAR